MKPSELIKEKLKTFSGIAPTSKHWIAAILEYLDEKEDEEAKRLALFAKRIEESSEEGKK